VFLGFIVFLLIRALYTKIHNKSRIIHNNTQIFYAKENKLIHLLLRFTWCHIRQAAGASAVHCQQETRRAGGMPAERKCYKTIVKNRGERNNIRIGIWGEYNVNLPKMHANLQKMHANIPESHVLVFGCKNVV